MKNGTDENLSKFYGMLKRANEDTVEDQDSVPKGQVTLLSVVLSREFVSALLIVALLLAAMFAFVRCGGGYW